MIGTPIQIIQWLYSKEKDKQFEIKEKRKKRSLSQNSYAWQLITEIGNLIGKSKVIKNNQEFIVYHVFTPSHELNTREFAFLLQGLCEECEEQGIETLSPDELKRLEEMIRG